MSTPQATEQYGQVLRVSVARASLNSRTSASASVGEKPISSKARSRQRSASYLEELAPGHVSHGNPLARHADAGSLFPSMESAVKGKCFRCVESGCTAPTRARRAELVHTPTDCCDLMWLSV